MDESLVASDARGPGGADLDVDANQLRIDIIPGESTPFLDPQSWIVDEGEDLDSLTIDILPSVSVSGQLVGYSATPYGAEVPGADETPVDGLVSMIRLGTIAGGSVSTDINGRFSLQVPPSSGYRLSAVPAEDHVLPFFVETDTSIEKETDLGVIDLGYGNPVYGRVTADNGDSIRGASVQLLSADSGVMGPRSLTDENGHFILRAQPGEYTVVVSGVIGQAIPTIRIPIEVVEDEGTEVDISVGSISTTAVYGQLFGPKLTTAQRDVRIRFTSEQLNDSEGSLEIVTETDGDGVFNRSLLAGTWVAELIPPFDSDLAPLQMTFTVSDGESMVNLGEIALPELVTFRSVAMDPSGNPVPGVAVNARELGFDGFIRSTTTDPDGWFELAVAPHPMALMLVPPGQDLAVTHVMVDPVTDKGSVAMSRGDIVEGRITSGGIGVPFSLLEIRDSGGLLYATSLSDSDGYFSVRMDVF
jgi:hypothetical protein